AAGATARLARQRQVMAAFRHSADAARDRRPRLALVVACEHVTVRGAGEERGASGPDVQREPFDVAVDVRRQAAFEVRPRLAAVTTMRCTSSKNPSSCRHVLPASWLLSSPPTSMLA